MRKTLISLNISALPFSEALVNTLEFAIKRKNGYACFANVHMVVEAWDDPVMKSAVNNADFVFADGMPVAKGLSLVFGEGQERIAGMDFIGPFLRLLDENKLRLVIFGGSESSHSEAQRWYDIKME
jgi:N-acetylglucosaminyldiphosphoundecaprenol N-acetyl-beta-D-mannosaminyltransferase